LNSTKNGFYGNQLQGKRYWGIDDRQTAKTTIIKFGLHTSFVGGLRQCSQRGIDDKNSVFALLDLNLKFSTHVYFMEQRSTESCFGGNPLDY
ncbi:hypothetical protein TNCV_2726901, partial [Trichonephila clavipes]